jgi:hypothetical protein
VKIGHLPVPTLRAFLLTFRRFAAGDGACPPWKTEKNIFRRSIKMEKKSRGKLIGKNGRAIFKQARGFVSGIIFTVLVISLAVTGFASTGTKTLQASYNNIKLYVDGNLITPKDASGNAVEPFISGGTTYLPVRAIGEALGKSVDWDGATQSVYIGSKTGGTTPETTTPVGTAYLTDAAPAYQSSSMDRYKEYSEKSGSIKSFAVSGVKYVNGCTWEDYSNQERGWSLYNLNGAYHTISGMIGHVDGTGMGSGTLNIFYDGVLTKTVEVSGAMIPQAINLDVSGVLQLRIVLSAGGSGSINEYALINPVIS